MELAVVGFKVGFGEELFGDELGEFFLSHLIGGGDVDDAGVKLIGVALWG